jgi:hypothetical protein
VAAAGRGRRVSLDARARRAAHDFRRAVDEMDRSAPDRSSFERFDRFRRRRQRDERIGVILVASALAIAAIVLLTRASPEPSDPPSLRPTTAGSCSCASIPDPTTGWRSRWTPMGPI